MKISSENILEDYDSFINSISKTDQQKLISFSFELKKSNKFSIVDHLSESFNDIFLFETPNGKLTAIGIDSCISLVPDNSKSFRSIYDPFNYWKNNFICNWNGGSSTISPIIFCAAKFDVNNSSNLWINFEPLRIFIPEIILSFQEEKLFCYYNFTLLDNKYDIYREKLFNFLRIFSELKSETVHSQPSEISIGSVFKPDNFSDWNDKSSKALELLESEEVNKLVLSRTNKFELKTPLSWYSVINKLNERFPDCYLFFLKKNNSVFFGSSPEMFLKILENTAEVESVAGSAARGEKKESDYELEKFLKSSEKNHKEHLFVSEFITDILIQYSNSVRVVEEKQIRKLDNIQHLLTKISAELNSKEIIFELIDSLFPTPAVCGVPKEKAIHLIRKLETHDRGLYSGIVGIFDFNGNCELAVSIRSALVQENQVTAFAGAGLVKDSNPEEEFVETNLKLKTILSLFTDENKS